MSEVSAAPAPTTQQRTFMALAEGGGDHAILLTDVDGVITFWGREASGRSWTPADAVGSHLRLLYPDGGAEDGTQRLPRRPRG